MAWAAEFRDAKGIACDNACKTNDAKRKLYGCEPGTTSLHPFELGGSKDTEPRIFDRCLHAELRDGTDDERAWVDYVFHLVHAKSQGSLSPYPGDYSARTITLIDIVESEWMAAQAATIRRRNKAGD